MAITNIDFEGTANEQQKVDAGKQDVNPANQEDTTSLDGKQDVQDINEEEPLSNTGFKDATKQDTKKEDGNDSDNSSIGELEEGMEVEYDGKVYVVDDKGNLVDDKGNIFKEAKDVAKFIEDNNPEEMSDDEININAIMDAIGLDILDENGNPRTFTNDPKGIAEYIGEAINARVDDIQQGAINKFFKDNPIVRQFMDYCYVNGSPRGFGDIPDRSGWTVDKDNEQQQAAIIMMAAQEFGNNSVNDNYIKYLQTNGALYEEAQKQLEALVSKDKAFMQELQDRAKQQQEEQQAELQQYWDDIHERVTKGKIGEYKLPEAFVKEVDGQKITLTKNDFYDYMSKLAYQDEEGNVLTAYQKDLREMSNEDSINRELLSAWLLFTGGSYEDLINMKVRENEVRRLVLTSKKQRGAKSVRVNKPKQGKVNVDDILLS